ncbi:conserved hypothetical protein [Deferribacter desulfuricans SSM1]|uniref:Uncharacterized protein n=1 Tax=Deferribacter desulfuricans (strain DSM 14783 / JCM 11476 / NBRC 101012 / SSM1) TaxID=639282 RepID=D3PCE4_DEFDS|nr:hypothetical protein [Deferribacter desulfuricans]BAI80267.1 conserved hypothetical protein [Deferribacter desulfuricans SSM1]
MNVIFFNIIFIINQLMVSAHFLRHSNIVLTAFFMISIIIIFFNEKIKNNLIKTLSIINILVWLFTMYQIVKIRIAFHEPFIRVIIILGVVIILNIVTLLFYPKKINR